MVACFGEQRSTLAVRSRSWGRACSFGKFIDRINVLGATHAEGDLAPFGEVLGCEKDFHRFTERSHKIHQWANRCKRGRHGGSRQYLLINDLWAGRDIWWACTCGGGRSRLSTVGRGSISWHCLGPK